MHLLCILGGNRLKWVDFYLSRVHPIVSYIPTVDRYKFLFRKCWREWKEINSIIEFLFLCNRRRVLEKCDCCERLTNVQTVSAAVLFKNWLRNYCRWFKEQMCALTLFCSFFFISKLKFADSAAIKQLKCAWKMCCDEFQFGFDRSVDLFILFSFASRRAAIRLTIYFWE